MKKILVIALAIIMIVSTMTLFASCSKKDVLVMATNANFPPYEYMEGNGYAGIDIEIAEKIAEKLNMELQIENVPFGSIITGVETGKYDMGIAGMTVTDERLKSVNFSTSYANGIQVVIVKEDSPYATINDFFVLDEEGNWTAVKEGVKVGVQQDTTGDIYASDTVENWGFGEDNVIRYNNGADAVQALIKGTVTCVIIDSEPAKNFVQANPGTKILETEYTNEDYAICVNKTNTELLEKINKALAELKEDGTLDQIIAKYIPAGK